MPHLNLEIVKSAGADEGLRAVLSTPSKDRDGEVVDAWAFNPLPDYIPIDIDHAMSVEKTVGSGIPYYDDAGILWLKELKFASTPLAKTVQTLVDERHIRTMSVAYGAARYEVDEKDGLPHLRSAELFNAAIVAIPSNRDSLILAAKSANLDPAVFIDPAVAEGKSAPTGAEADTDDSAAAAADKAAAAAVPRPVGFYRAVAEAHVTPLRAD
jgi:HK97 family phage prohead protease